MTGMRAWVASLHCHLPVVIDHYHYSHCSIERFEVHVVGDVGDYCEIVDDVDGEQCSDGSTWPCHALVPVHAHMTMTMMMMTVMMRHRAVW